MDRVTRGASAYLNSNPSRFPFRKINKSSSLPEWTDQNKHFYHSQSAPKFLRWQNLPRALPALDGSVVDLGFRWPIVRVAIQNHEDKLLVVSLRVGTIYYTLISPILPLLLIYRIAQDVWYAKHYQKQFILTFPITFISLSCWSLREFWGYASTLFSQ